MHQLGARLHAEVLHDRVFMKSHGPRTCLEKVRNFLNRVVFREKSQHFALARGTLLRTRLRGLAEKGLRCTPLGNERRDVVLPVAVENRMPRGVLERLDVFA